MGQREMKDMESNSGTTKMKEKGESIGQREVKDKGCINQSTKMNDIL